MVDVLGGVIFVIALIYTGSILLSFRSRRDFFGIGIGIFIATAISFFARNFLWGIVQGVV